MRIKLTQTEDIISRIALAFLYSASIHRIGNSQIAEGTCRVKMVREQLDDGIAKHEDPFPVSVLGGL